MPVYNKMEILTKACNIVHMLTLHIKKEKFQFLYCFIKQINRDKIDSWKNKYASLPILIKRKFLLDRCNENGRQSDST